MRHLSCPPDVELLGLYVTAFTDNLQGEETKPIMEKYNLVNLQPMEWYPCQRWMDALNELAKLQNVSKNMVAMGMKIGQMIPVPPDMKDPNLEKMLMAWDSSYQYVHRGGDVGSVLFEKVDDHHYKTTHTHLYPDDLTYGILYAYAKRFLPPKTSFSVFYDPDIPIRDKGGTGATVIHVQWS